MHKVAFQLGPFTVHWYGVLVAAGFAIGLWTASRRSQRDGIPAGKILDLGAWLIVSTLVGARLLYVLSYWEDSFAGKPWTEVFMIHHGGLVFYGGLIGAALTMATYFHVKKLPMWKYGDALAPSIALGSVFGRLGCLMNGCCYGRPTDLPWAITFPADHPTHPAGLHPTQIYDCLLNLALYLVLAWLYRRKKFDGQIFASFLVGYALLRGVVELSRGDYSAGQLSGWFTPAHGISAAIFAAGLVLFWILSHHPKPKRS